MPTLKGLTMNEMKRLLSFVRRAVDDYNMISDGDKIAVGVSGGKDSLTLLEVLAEMRRFYPKKYDVVAVTVDMGFPSSDFSEIAELCRRIKVEYKIVKTDIAKIIFDTIRKCISLFLKVRFNIGPPKSLPASGIALTKRRSRFRRSIEL